MSFIENRSDVSICNKALSRIYQTPITGALNDASNLNKLAPRECARWYPTVVRRLLEQHHFGIATKRVALAAVAGSRQEWAYAYAPPSDMAFPVSVQPFTAASSVGGIGWYQGLGYILASLHGRPHFLYQNGVLYSNLPNATLDYVSFNITAQDFTATFEDLVVKFLSAELALPIAKDRALSNDLRQEATQALNTAIAVSLNTQNPRWGDGPSEAEYARAGFSSYLPDLRGLY